MIRAFLRSKIHRATVTTIDHPKIVLMGEGNRIAAVR